MFERWPKESTSNFDYGIRRVYTIETNFTREIYFRLLIRLLLSQHTDVSYTRFLPYVCVCMYVCIVWCTVCNVSVRMYLCMMSSVCARDMAFSSTLS